MTDKDKPLTLEQLTNVGFPHTIIAAEVESLMSYISCELDCDVRYTTETSHTIEPGEVPVKRIEVISIDGQISSMKQGIALLPFSAKRELVEEGSRYSSLVFQTTPGYDLEEIPPQEARLMETVKIIVGNYFKSIQTKPDREP